MNSRSTTAVLVFVLVLGTSLAACGESEEGAAAPPPASSSAASGTGTAVATSSPGTTGPALEVVDRGGSVTCAEASGRADVALWVGSLKASAPVRIRDVGSPGAGAEAVGGLAVPVTDPDAFGGQISEWPPVPPSRQLARSVDWEERSNLRGLELQAGEEVRVVLRVVGGPGTRLGAAEISYLDGAEESTVELPVGFRFAARCSR